MYLNPSLESLYGAEVSYCPRCKINRVTTLKQCSRCGTDYQVAIADKAYCEFDPEDLAVEFLQLKIEKEKRRTLKKMIEGEYLIVKGEAPQNVESGTTVAFKRKYCNLLSAKDLYAITKDRYGYNLLVQPYPNGAVVEFTLESLENGDVAVKNTSDCFILRS